MCAAQFAKLDAAVARAVDGVDDPIEAFRRHGLAYIDFGVAHPEEYRIIFMTKGEITRAEFEAGTMPGIDSFRQVVDAVQRCIDVGAIAPRDPFLVATGVWALVHGITSLRISVPGFPLVGDPAFVDHCFEVVIRGLAP